MTSYAEDESAQRKVRDSAAVLSGQRAPKIADETGADQNILLIKAWSEETKSIIEFWEGYLTGDRDDPIELIEASGLKITTQSLRRGLVKYFFAEDARFRSVDIDAWNGIQPRWASIHKKVSKLFVEVTDYHNWLFEVNEKYAQITDPIAIRNLIRQKRVDTNNIVVLYAEVVAGLEPLFEEILEYLLETDSYVIIAIARPESVAECAVGRQWQRAFRWTANTDALHQTRSPSWPDHTSASPEAPEN